MRGGEDTTFQCWAADWRTSIGVRATHKLPANVPPDLLLPLYPGGVVKSVADVPSIEQEVCGELPLPGGRKLAAHSGPARTLR